MQAAPDGPFSKLNGRAPYQPLRPLDQDAVEVVNDSFPNTDLAARSQLAAEQYPDGTHLFLCLDWVLYRLYETKKFEGSEYEKLCQKKMGDLMDKSTTARETNIGYNYDTLIAALNVDRDNGFFGLAESLNEDGTPLTGTDAVVIAWATNGNLKSIAHVQVKYEGRWESKLGEMYQVISHGALDFEHHRDGYEVVKVYKYRGRK
ncbi:hypothetical protein PENSPDRAFT_683179 [Peniophora sp. CONT]|nr:hypothetical protein PENSPDRAFT_683179 [Peniophora sp. CONT]